jgi:hypothetical protein
VPQRPHGPRAPPSRSPGAPPCPCGACGGLESTGASESSSKRVVKYATAVLDCEGCKHCRPVPLRLQPPALPSHACCSPFHTPTLNTSTSRDTRTTLPVRSSGATCASDSLTRLPANAIASSASVSAAIMRRLRFASDAEARPWRDSAALINALRFNSLHGKKAGLCVWRRCGRQDRASVCIGEGGRGDSAALISALRFTSLWCGGYSV